MKPIAEGSKVRAENIILGTYEKDYEELQAENKRLNMRVEAGKRLVESKENDVSKYTEKLQAENKRLMKQVSSNRGNSSSTHTHTISKEIQDYMHHNPNCKGVRLFILPIESFDGNGIYDANYGDVYYSDGIE